MQGAYFLQNRCRSHQTSDGTTIKLWSMVYYLQQCTRVHSGPKDLLFFDCKYSTVITAKFSIIMGIYLHIRRDATGCKSTIVNALGHLLEPREDLRQSWLLSRL